MMPRFPDIRVTAAFQALASSMQNDTRVVAVMERIAKAAELLKEEVRERTRAMTLDPHGPRRVVDVEHELRISMLESQVELTQLVAREALRDLGARLDQAEAELRRRLEELGSPPR